MINIDSNLCYAWPSETGMYSLALGFFSLAYPAVFLWHQSSRASLADLFSLDSSSYNTKKYHVILGCVHCCLLVFNQANSVWTIEHNLYLLKTISISERLFCFPLWLIKCISLSARIHWWKIRCHVPVLKIKIFVFKTAAWFIMTHLSLR